MKSLLDFIEPHGLVFTSLFVLSVLLWRARQRRFALVTGVLWLFVALLLCTPFSSWLLSTLERPWPPVKFADIEACDAVVCLGGGFESSRMEPSGVRLKNGADRLFCAVEMARQGRARALVMGGGAFRFENAQGCEADAAKAWIESWQMATVPVHSLGICADTHDEAEKVAALATEQKWTRIALVTSASHMTRAKATFEKAGVPVLPV
ncbi:MAG: YdcF family protein, partial [Verrucomicrobiaceae bacterium]|nr:YdcF family protein [Verrucomicrobiaceae bacterium]